MAELNMTIRAENEAAAPATRSRAVSMPEARAEGRGFTFEWFLVVTFILLGAAGAYESVTECYFPALSLVRAAHVNGYLKAYPVVYEPSKGIWHLVGWTGSAMMVVMMLYTVRKRFSFMGALGSMRRWLNVHMFFGIMGPLLVTLHTTFKFHGIIATSFWCMIVTMVFGILGRYIYVQIPRSITGAELGVAEIEAMVAKIDAGLKARGTTESVLKFLNDVASPGEKVEDMNLVAALFYMMWKDVTNRFMILRAGWALRRRFRMEAGLRHAVMGQIKKKAALIRKKNLLATSHRMLHYWHVFHVPLAIVMFLIMFLHIAVYYVFRPV